MNLGAPVLIIDDDPAMIEAMKEMLEATGQCAVVASNGFHGLRLAREVKPAVIVCDLVMPQMAGADVLRALASDPCTARIPRVLMTGRSDADQSCADGFLQKPFQADDMLKLLKRIASRPRIPKIQSDWNEARWQG
jgi:CheY-like chemotaxis protein